jgi:glycosyltransferase involved in cell wall biosynthesis
MSDSPLVTVGLPVYNSERYVETSLKSLLNQTYSDFVLIISDNASTDRTGEICQAYAAADPRIQYSRNTVNVGNPGNFNRIANMTTTKYLKWSTADDYWEPTFLERGIEVMERDASIALCYPQATLVDADGLNPTPYDDVLHLMDDDPAERFLAVIDRIKLAHQHLGVIRMSALRRTHLLGAHVGSDINLLSELAIYGKYYELPERLFNRRFHKDSGSWKRGDKEHEARRYHAAKRNPRALMRMWRTHVGHLKSVHASPLPLSDKVRLYRILTRRMLMDRDILRMEIGDFLHTTTASKEKAV